MSNYRILVTGSRHRGGSSIWRRVEAVVLDAQLVSPRTIVIVHGGCTGVDETADVWAEQSGHAVEPHPADWSRGEQAGPERNQRMVDLGADVCLAFPAPDSRGTWDCIRRAVAAGIETRIYPEPKP